MKRITEQWLLSQRKRHDREMKAALEEYLLNPNVCGCCQEKILPIPGKKLTETKEKKFCNKSCAAKFNNQVFPKRRKPPTHKVCNTCLREFHYTRSSQKRCRDCKIESNVDHLLKPKSNFSRQAIASHARKVAQRSIQDSSCLVCGYSTHVEACHKKSVSSFPDTSPIGEVNHPDNLMYLCPNHHWEFDHGHLSF